MNVHLVGIDWQNDFCDPNKGALYVGGTQARFSKDNKIYTIQTK